MRDSYTGLDYADQRFYASTYGRFNTPDPYSASGGPGDPSSWNRYSYTRGDPVNRIDRSGLADTTIDVTDTYSALDYMTFSVPTNLQGGYFGNMISGAIAAALSSAQSYIQTFAGPTKITVAGYSRTGPQEAMISNDLTNIQNSVLTGDCAKWLTGQDFSASDVISAMMTAVSGGPSFGYGTLNSNTTAAFVGNVNTDGTPVAGLPADASIDRKSTRLNSSH